MPADVPALAIPAEQLWTVRDAAAFLRIGRNAVYEMVKRDEVPNVRVGSRVRFVPSELRAWLGRQRSPCAIVGSLAKPRG
jgi:excisionase family DNA binding protein